MSLEPPEMAMSFIPGKDFFTVRNNLQSVHDIHVDVGDDQIGFSLFQPLHPLTAISDGLHGVARVLQYALQRFQHRSVIINQ